MKLPVLVTSSVIVGLAAGVGSGLWRTDLFSSSSSSPRGTLSVDDSALPPLPDAGGAQPSVEVDNPVYNFGHMERYARGEHAYIVKNVGEAPLVLTKGPTTCKCTLSQLSEVEIPPGDSTKIKLEWEAKGDSPEFRHGATIYTNDREHRTLKLEIEGTLVDALALNPPEIVFSNLSSDEEVSGRSRLATIRSDDLAVVGYTFENQDTARFFAVKTEPLAPESLPEGTKSGCEVVVTIKPGLPPGTITQTIRLKTNVPDSADLELKVEGRIGTPVMIVGHNWNQDAGLLRLGVVARAQGMTSDLKIMIRGPHRQTIRLLPPKADPDWMRVTLGTPQDLGSVVAVPVTVAIPPNAPVVNRLGSTGGPYATITFGSDPPEVGDIRMNVGFAVAE